MRSSVRIVVVLSTTMMLVAGAHAQEQLGSGSAQSSYAGGWTFTPSFGLSETYDDNISLSGVNTFENVNNDYVATYFPGADLHYGGKHTTWDTGYTGSFLQYQTFSNLNRWNQHAHVDLRRQETLRWKWYGRGNVQAMPSTDAIELGGIPFRHTGATTADARAGVSYDFSARDGVSTAVNYQRISFDRPDDPRVFLRGGRVFESMNGWRHKISSRTAFGADYSYRRALVAGDLETFNLHTVQAAVDHDLDASWSVSGAAGLVYLESTATINGRTGPAWRIAVERHRASRTFHARYMRTYIPSFGFGGTIQNQEAGVGYRTPLFNNRRVYLDTSMVFRNDTPLTTEFQTLPLRSLRGYATVGWSPQPWVRMEGFYTHLSQSSLVAGGRLDRNRIGFQIVTSKPMRID